MIYIYIYAYIIYNMLYTPKKKDIIANNNVFVNNLFLDGRRGQSRQR